MRTCYMTSYSKECIKTDNKIVAIFDVTVYANIKLIIFHVSLITDSHLVGAVWCITNNVDYCLHVLPSIKWAVMMYHNYWRPADVLPSSALIWCITIHHHWRSADVLPLLKCASYHHYWRPLNVLPSFKWACVVLNHSPFALRRM